MPGSHRRRRSKDLGNVGMERRLIVVYHHQIVAACLDHLGTDSALAVQGIAREHAPFPINLFEQGWNHGQFGLVLGVVHAELGQHHAKLMAKGTDGMNRVRALGFIAQSSAVCFAVNGNALRPTWASFTRKVGVKCGSERGFEGGSVKATKEALESGDMRGMVRGKAKSTFDSGGLGSTPFSDGKE